MGYVSKDIAVINEPDIVTLSTTPNFVQFASKTATKTYLEVSIKVNLNAIGPLSWISGEYYNAAGIIGDDPAYKRTDPRDISEYAGKDIYFKGYAYDLAYCVFTDIHGDVIGSFQSQDGFFSGAVPDNAKYIMLSNRWADDPNPYLRIFVGNENNSAITITNADGTARSYIGTRNAAKVDGNTFYISDVNSDTAENLRQALLADKRFNANFEVVIPTVWHDGNPVNGDTLIIKSKSAGADFNMGIDAPNNANDVAYTITWINRTSVNNDSISGEASTAEIDLDIYADPEVFLGQDDRPITPAKIGTYVTTLQKTYAGVPLWFELNALFSQYGGHNLPSGSPGWFDTGTARTYRFAAKIKAANSFYFYQSNALYVISGTGPVSAGYNLSPYIYLDNTIRLLTNKPRTPYVRGQREFLNFIFADPQRGGNPPTDFTLRVAYRAYSTGDTYLGTVYGQERARADFWIVNTCRLDIDAVLDQFPTAGIVRVALARGTAIVSNDLEYTVRPECLHTLRQFSFINRLGGWDTFNFDAGVKDEIKPDTETYTKTLTPGYRRGDSIETVYNTTLANTFTVEGAPVTDDVAAWLKELAAARVVLANDGNYIIIEDFTLQVSAADKNMQKPTIKYRLSE